jgi:hypothetical protein
MNQVILIESRNVWGNTNHYVVGEHADAVRRLTGKKTVDASDVRALEALGFICRTVAKQSMPACEAVLR